MSLFRKLFGKKKQDPSSKNKEEGKYMPEIKLPVDERFTVNFTENGGKFLYCEDMDEVFSSLNSIIKENYWQEKSVLLLDDNLKTLFKNTDLNPTKTILRSDFFLTTCENLIADDGSLLISSNQIAEKKLNELPANFVVYATTSQIVENIGEGLRLIKSKNKERIPTNITTIKHFQSEDNKNDGNDFLTYGISTKHLYLLLLEDL